MIVDTLNKLVCGQDLSREEIADVFNQIMNGEITPAQISAFITALRCKGETSEEITGAAMVMRKFSEKIKVNAPVVLDTCGTGGSGTNTFNVSTLTALVTSAAGITVAKHGNRGVSSKSGSADIMEHLGVNINAEIATVERCINSIGIGFLFAPKFHPAMKYAIGPRKEIGIRTIFNVLGPLTNPANANCQLLGVYHRDLTEPLAKVLCNLGLKQAMVVHGEDGMDEVTITGRTFAYELKNNQVFSREILPEDYGIARVSLSQLKVNSVAESAVIVKEVLSGKKSPFRDSVVLNSACALYVAGAAESIAGGITLAQNVIDSGKAMVKLNLLIKFSHEINSQENN